MKKVLIIFGTRPEAIKMAPLVLLLKSVQNLKVKVCVTAQHREMLDMVLKLFKIEPDFDLNLMSAGQSVTEITVRVLTELEKVLHQEQPELVLVHGDTTTTMAAALASFYQQIPVGHVEAGLRSCNIYSPYPEEMNRRLTASLATMHFAPTQGNRDNLVREGINEKHIYVTGNTVIDALYMVAKESYSFKDKLLKNLDFNENRIILLTAHRRENWGRPLQNIFTAVRRLAEEFQDTIFVYPVHLNPLVSITAKEVLGHVPRVHLIEPLDFEPFVNLMARAFLVLTDSGGIQEEAPALGKPVLVLRRETERPEAVEAGTVKVVGVEIEDIYQNAARLLNNSIEYDKMSKAVNPFGDGQAADRIMQVLTAYLRI